METQEHGIGSRTIYPKPGTDFSWRNRGACVGADSNLFFPPSEGDEDYTPNNRHLGDATAKRYARAVKFCDVCPVIGECLNWALTMPEKAGFWGGASEDERAEMRRQRKNAERRLRRAPQGREKAIA
jgi:WhiB family transcriptional regulator, redox-sensing transcriptional regulator